MPQTRHGFAVSMMKSFVCLLLSLFVFHDSEAQADFIIDAHAHIGNFRGFAIGEKHLIDAMQRNGIRFGIVSNLDAANLRDTRNVDEFQANRDTAEFVKRFKNQFRGLLWARPIDGSSQRIEGFLLNQRELFVGIKFHPEFNQFAADDHRVDPYLTLCEKYSVAAVFHCGARGSNSDPEKIYSIARRHPKVQFVLYHMGFFGPHDSAIRVAVQARKRKDAQIFLETSQAETSGVLEALRELGSDAVLFGTDATYYGRNHYSKYKQMLETLRSKLSRKDFIAVTSGNAIRIFQLKQMPEHTEGNERSVRSAVN